MHRFASPSAMLSPPEPSQIAGSAMPRMRRPRRFGSSCSISRMLAASRPGVHFTPMFGSPVQPYSSRTRYIQPSRSTAHQPTENGRE
ncbi:MAG: hypothetical protein K2O74_07015 [Eubacteriales bacterium]|nr:hypothetical protein [Eubacteriales bacterium]